jgi:RNA polymerase sigma factor (TIGR02999 family)
MPTPPEPEKIPADTDITQLLNLALAGDAASQERVYTLLYAELLRLSRSYLFGSDQPSLNPAALVHEAYLRMLGRQGTPLRDRRAYFAYASTVMRSVLVDHVRARGADKRGGDWAAVTLNTGVLDSVAQSQDFAQLDEALDMLRSVDARGCRVVEMRYFAGMTEEEIALELSVSLPTVKRDWRKARAFLFEQLR